MIGLVCSAWSVGSDCVLTDGLTLDICAVTLMMR